MVTELRARLSVGGTLVAYTESSDGAADVHPFCTHPQGYLIYTADGFVSAQPVSPGYDDANLRV